MSFDSFHGIKILNGPHDNPGSGKAFQHEEEYHLFISQINKLENISDPVMLEIGAFWGLWSLVFRKKYESGKNILIEYGSHQLEVGKRNFELNKYSADFIHGGIALNHSGTQIRKITDILYTKNSREGVEGPELDIKSELDARGITKIDLLHMDIQGSELAALELFKQSNLFDTYEIKIIYVATYSALIHSKIKRLMIPLGFDVEHEDLTFGKLGSIIFRIKRKIKREKFLDFNKNDRAQKIIYFIESKMNITGQTSGIGKDGLLVFSRL